MNVAIIIPALNEEESIPQVLKEIPRDLVREIIVVDNGSSDGTAEVARANGARVVREKRRGYGAACLRGIAELREEIDVVVFLDADYSDYPEDLGRILEPIGEGEADFVIGSRVLGERERGALLWNQRLGNYIACNLIRLLYRRRFTDMGPFRALKRECLSALSMQDADYGWNVEMQVKAISYRMAVREVPVRYRKRLGKSKISGTVRGTILAGAKIVWTILRIYPLFLRERLKRK